MTNDEFEKTKEFILQQQAQFASDIQRSREAQTQTDLVLTHVGEVLAQTGEIVGRLAHVTHEGFTDVNAKINALVDSQIRTDEKINALADSQAQMDEKIKALFNSQINLTDAQSRTDEKINALVDSQKQTDDKFRELADSQKQTTEDLKKLIANVDRYFTGRNGNNHGS
jgi:ABC-type transporter Mla subunit MlaD